MLEKCERQRLRDVLTQEQKKIEKELVQKRQQKLQQAKKDSGEKTDTALKGYTVKINNYGRFIPHNNRHRLFHNDMHGLIHLPLFVSLLGWDQSDKFVKIYITLKGVHTIPAENVEAKFTERCGLTLNIASFYFIIFINSKIVESCLFFDAFYI